MHSQGTRSIVMGQTSDALQMITMDGSKQVNYYVDVNIQDQIAELKGLFGPSREHPGARLTE